MEIQGDQREAKKVVLDMSVPWSGRDSVTGDTTGLDSFILQDILQEYEIDYHYQLWCQHLAEKMWGLQVLGLSEMMIIKC